MLATLTVEEMEAYLGEQLKRLRLDKNLDQKTLAGRAGVSVRALRNLEGGAGTTIKTLLSVVRALGRESWLDTVGPVATINPLALTSRASQRQRATKRRVMPPPASTGAAASRNAMSSNAPDIPKAMPDKTEIQ